MENLIIVDHPLVQHKLTLLRDKTTPTVQFRQLMREITFLLGAEVLRDLPLGKKEIETPLEAGTFPYLDGKKLCFVSILRAGNGFLDALLELVPAARVGHIGMQRNEKTLKAEQYYLKLPANLEKRQTVLVDPMLATGGSASDAASLLKEKGAKQIKMLCLVAAPEGVANFTEAHPDIPIFTAGLDRSLNEIGYILPGLGDAGDRIYGTKG